MLRVLFGVNRIKWHQGEKWVCLLRLWFIAKIQAGGTLGSTVTGIWRSCQHCHLWKQHRSLEIFSLLVAFVISLPAML